jgi:hypothetical protein
MSIEYGHYPKKDLTQKSAEKTGRSEHPTLRDGKTFSTLELQYPPKKMYFFAKALKSHAHGMQRAKSPYQSGRTH